MNKIIFFHLGGTLGGAPISLAALVGRLDRSRFEPLVILTDDGPAKELFRQAGVAVRSEPLPSGLFARVGCPLGVRRFTQFLVNYPLALVRTKRILELEKPDIVHLNTSPLLAQAVAAHRLGIPVIWHVREKLRGDWVGQLLVRQISRWATHIITTTDAVGAMFSESDRVRTIYNGVDLARFHPTVAAGARARVRRELSISDHHFVVGILGTVSREKGHHLLLQAASEIIASYPNVLFLLVGAGDIPKKDRDSWKIKIKNLLGRPLNANDEMQRKVRESGLSDHFLFLPFRHDIPEILGATDLVIFPSREGEGFGRPLMEAMAVARPIVATSIGPTAEIMDDGDTGWLVPPEDSGALGHAIVDCANQPAEVFTQMGRIQRQRAEELFDLCDHVKQVQQVYQEVL